MEGGDKARKPGLTQPSYYRPITASVSYRSQPQFLISTLRVNGEAELNVCQTHLDSSVCLPVEQLVRAPDAAGIGVCVT